MTNTDNSMNLPIGLKVLPWTWRRSTDHELEPEATGIPRLIRKRTFLVLGVERTDGGEFDPLVTSEH